MNHILKATSKGQITLPAKWRKNFDTDQYLVKEKAGKLEITPIDLDELENDSEWVTIFSAERDNDGEGIDIDEFIEALENTL
ncbi:AbrB/MazE/SpoVT family DNA-binding domain-containing protein [bacterium]|nr:AbrB/MazE/SpoVT family DNA-binding domain-containing protein [bacterium]